MNAVGIDIGSRTIKLAVCESGKIVMTRKALTSYDPLRSVAEAILKIPCSCMMSKGGQLDQLDEPIVRFRPDVVIDVVLHAYNVESYKIMGHVKEKHGLPCLKIETDYSDDDVEQVGTREDALFDSM